MKKYRFLKIFLSWPIKEAYSIVPHNKVIGEFIKVIELDMK